MSTGAQDTRPNDSANGEATELVRLLAELDAAVPVEVSESLLPGASDEALQQLSRTGLQGRPLPADLAALLRWHNGQEWNAELSPKNNRRLLTVVEIIQEWSFFNDSSNDYLEPRSPSWVPILTNDSGDSVVYETDGPRSGVLIAYWHDDPDRPLEYASLRDWAATLLGELRDKP